MHGRPHGSNRRGFHRLIPRPRRAPGDSEPSTTWSPFARRMISIEASIGASGFRNSWPSIARNSFLWRSASDSNSCVLLVFGDVERDPDMPGILPVVSEQGHPMEFDPSPRPGVVLDPRDGLEGTLCALRKGCGGEIGWRVIGMNQALPAVVRNFFNRFSEILEVPPVDVGGLAVGVDTPDEPRGGVRQRAERGFTHAQPGSRTLAGRCACWRAGADAAAPPRPAEFDICQGCHGVNGQGNAELGAPRIAGLDAQYIGRQLTDFRDRRRGASDSFGEQMIAITAMLDEATIGRLSAYVGAMPEVADDPRRCRATSKRGSPRYAVLRRMPRRAWRRQRGTGGSSTGGHVRLVSGAPIFFFRFRQARRSTVTSAARRCVASQMA